MELEEEDLVITPEHVQIDEMISRREQAGGPRELILFNDDVNTFEHVIDCLVDICGHDPVQAEQCAWIVHNNGKCSVKCGSHKTLEPMGTALLERGLSVEIR